MNCFKPVTLALAVVAVKDIYSISPDDPASEIAEAVCLDRTEDHSESISQRDRYDGR